MHDRSADRFSLVTAAQRFVVTALPFRDHESWVALREVMAALSRTRVAAPDVNAILLEVLAVLDSHVSRVMPTLVERFVRRRRDVLAVDTFQHLVEAVLASQIVADPFVSRAIAEINSYFADPNLRTVLAQRVGLSQAALATRFVEATGAYPIEYLRNVRLEWAAQKLSRFGVSVKEVWASVGYNMPSTFNHDFKKKFGKSPTEYRACCHALPSRIDDFRQAIAAPEKLREEMSDTSREMVMVVDDDESTRETLACGLRLEGYTVTAAASGEECLAVGATLPCRAIVVDYHLPGMNGVQCVQVLRQRRFVAPALICSADWDLEERQPEFLALGARYLSKPCSLDAVIAIVAECTT